MFKYWRSEVGRCLQEFHEVGHILYIELCHGTGAMNFDGLLSDAEAVANLLVE